jgi:hypothetical protein
LTSELSGNRIYKQIVLSTKYIGVLNLKTLDSFAFRLCVVKYCVVVKTPMAIAGRFRKTSRSAGGGQRMQEGLWIFIQYDWLAEKNAEHKDEFRSLAILVRIFPGSWLKYLVVLHTIPPANQSSVRRQYSLVRRDAGAQKVESNVAK